jgi:hypothetical protein
MDLKYEILELGLVYYKNILKNPQEIIDMVNEIDHNFMSNQHGDSFTEVEPWLSWKVDDRDVSYNWKKFFPKPDAIKNSDYYATKQRYVSSRLYESLDLATNHYLHVVYPFAQQSIKAREYNQYLTRYEKHGGLPLHNDQENVGSRTLGSILYLNDDYDGGELRFPEFGISLKPEAGSVVMFPSNFLYMHEVLPMTNGSRYAMPHWYHNTEDWQKNIKIYDIEHPSDIII